ATVQAIQQTTQAGMGGLIDTLTKAKDALDSHKPGALEAVRVTKCQDLTGAMSDSQQQDAKDASAECLKAQQQAQDESAVLGATVADLQGTLQGIYKYFQSQENRLCGELKSLTEIIPPPAAGAARLTPCVAFPTAQAKLDAEV